MLITDARIISWDRPNSIVDDAALLIADGKISEIGSSVDLVRRHPDEEKVSANGQFVMPGLINTHTHFYSLFVKGLSVPGDRPWSLPTLLERIWWPFDKAVDEQTARYGALAALVDAIRHGTTLAFDHHSSPNFVDGVLDVVADAVGEAGIRAVLCYETTDRNGPVGTRAGIAENARFIGRCAREDVAGGRVKATFGIHAPMTVSDATLETIREAAPADAGFHVHVGEHEYDEYRSVAISGMRSVDRLDWHGLLNERTICAHAIHLDAKEIALLADAKARVSHQPRNNMNIGAGVADVEAFLRSGVPVSIGTDGLSSTMWKEWEYAAMAQKLVHRDARRLPADAVIEMGAYNGAGLANEYFGEAPLGIIQAGAFADLIFVDYHPVTPLTAEVLPGHIVFGFNESMVTTSIVDGKILMRDRQLQTLDEERIAARCRELAPALWERYQSLVPTGPLMG